MFCPNCGKDCGDANLCTNCGRFFYTESATQTFTDRERELQKSGLIYCPRCLSTNITVQSKGSGVNTYLYMRGMLTLASLLFAFLRKAERKERGEKCVCRVCGNKWYTKKTALQRRHREILEKYLGVYYEISMGAPGNACLQLGEVGIKIYRSQSNVQMIPYEEITAVMYQENVGPLYGWLSIRDRANKNKSFPNTYADAQQDELTIFCHYHYASGYHQIFCALKDIVEENKKAGMF